MFRSSACRVCRARSNRKAAIHGVPIRILGASAQITYLEWSAERGSVA